MNMPINLFATAFRKQHLGLMFSIIMIIMVYLGSLAMASQSTLARTSLTWGHNLQNRFTVEIPSQSNEVSNLRLQREEKIVTYLKTLPDVINIETLSEENTARLINPWVTDEALLASLPLPSLLDINLKTGHRIDIDKLQTKLSRLVDDTRIHAHASWMNNLLGFLRGLGFLAVIMLILTALAIIISIYVICRAAMSVQQETIELLHFMGSTDLAIAKQFQQHIRKLAIPASLIGFTAALVTVFLLALLLNSLGGMSLIASSSWVTVGIVMSLIPIGAIGLAILTARISVLKLLQRLP